MRYGLLLNGKIENVIESSTNPGLPWVPCGDAGPGWIAGPNNTFTAPSASAPTQRIGTHLWFRGHFTQTERENIDELEATFESNPGLTATQKRQLRTGFKDYNMGTDVNKDDPRIPPMLGLFVTLGLLGTGRPAEILA